MLLFHYKLVGEIFIFWRIYMFHFSFSNITFDVFNNSLHFYVTQIKPNLIYLIDNEVMQTEKNSSEKDKK